MKKRILSMLLALIMLASLLPTAALADYTADDGGSTPVYPYGKDRAEGAVKPQTEPDGYETLETGTTEWNGKYTVKGEVSLSGVTVKGNTTVYIGEGATLTITGKAGAERSDDYQKTGASKPDTQNYCGVNGITIDPNMTLTFTGPGKLEVTGGNGGKGVNGGASGNNSMNWGAGGGRGGDGVYVGTGAKLKFADTFTGEATITGGRGGKGGAGTAASTSQSGMNYKLSADIELTAAKASDNGGSGGNGGDAGYGISNHGEVIFAQDAANDTLKKHGTYTTGTVNVKGGTGGAAGAAGASRASNSSIAASRTYDLHSDLPDTYQNNGNECDQKGSFSCSGYSYAEIRLEFSNPGDAGKVGDAGFGIYNASNATVTMEGGVTGVEGGNSGAGQLAAGSLTYTHYYYATGTTAYTCAGYEAKVDEQLTTKYHDGVGSVDSCESITGKTYTYRAASKGSTGSPAVAVSGGKILNKGGVSYFVKGDNKPDTALDSVTVSSTEGSTGTLYNGNGSTAKGNDTGTYPVRVNYLQGTDEFKEQAQNFHVLNEGDKWTDAAGKEKGSDGLKVNGKTWSTRDLYVSPQGYLFLSGVDADDEIEFDVAIGATRSGSAGAGSREICLSSDSRGVYHFTGTVGSDGSVTARWAADASSFDVYWLEEQAKEGFDREEEITVSTAAQLAAVAWAVNNNYADRSGNAAAAASYKLYRDIDLGSFDWTPIGTEAHPFTGSFDGNGKTVKNLRLSAIEGTDSYGLFGTVSGATIQNVSLARDSFTDDREDTVYNNGSSSSAGSTSGGEYSILDKNVVKISRNGDAMVGAVAGHAIDSTIEGVTATDIPVEAESKNGNACLGGIAGLAENTGIRNSSVMEVNANPDDSDGISGFKATADAGSAWAGGIAGKVTGTTKAAAAVTGTSVMGKTKETKVDVLAKGGQKACAGGIIGEGLEAAVFSNIYLDSAASGANTVKADAGTDNAWAGGLIGRIKNTGYGRVAAAEMTISNIAVTAASDGGSVWVGGTIGEAYAASGVELTDLNVKGGGTEAEVKAEGAGDVYAGRLAGQSNSTTILNCAFDNTESVSVSAVSTGGGSVYAGGLVGRLDESGSVNNSGVWKTDITAETAGSAWAGGLLGYAEDTSITASHVNYKATDSADTADSFAKSTLTVTGGAAAACAGGLAGEIVNPARSLDTNGENSYKTNNAAQVAMTLPEKNVTAGGLFGKINDALIGTSYARGYEIKTADGTVPTGRVAGVAGVLDSSELIGVYAVQGKNAVTTYPGMYAEGEGNRFYGCYVYHTAFAPNPDEDGNEYANTFHVDDTGSAEDFGYLNSRDYGTAEKAEGYYITSEAELDGSTVTLYELRSACKGTVYKHAELAGLPADAFTGGAEVNDSIWSLLHFFRDDNSGDITTRYEKRLGYSIAFSRTDGGIEKNWNAPMITIPKVLTLAVKPGLDYGHIKESDSTFSEVGSRSYTPDAHIYFTAEEQATQPSDSWFYSFNSWTVKSSTGTVTTYDEDSEKHFWTDYDNADYTALMGRQAVYLVMPNGSLSVTANFKRNDNWFRAQINSALSAAIKTALAKTEKETEGGEEITLGEELQTLLDEGKNDEAAGLLLDELELGSLSEENSVYWSFDRYLSNPTGEKSGNDTGKSFADVYPNANTTLYSRLKDRQMVIKQLVRDAVTEVMNRDTFTAGSYEVDITRMTVADDPATEELEGGKAEYVDIGVDVFTSGSFNKYVASQYVYEQSGKENDESRTDNSRPGILSANGMTVKIGAVFTGSGNPARDIPAAPTNDDKGDTYRSAGVYVSYVDPTSVGSDGMTEQKEDENGNVTAKAAYIWTEVSPDASGDYLTTLDAEQLKANADGDEMYVYLRQVDENGYEIVTRVPVKLTGTAAENETVNNGGDGKPVTANTGIGNGESAERAEDGTLRSESSAIIWGEVLLRKAEPVSMSGRDYYVVNGRGGDEGLTTYETEQQPGAYATGISLEVPVEQFNVTVDGSEGADAPEEQLNQWITEGSYSSCLSLTARTETTKGDDGNDVTTTKYYFTVDLNNAPKTTGGNIDFSRLGLKSGSVFEKTPAGDDGTPAAVYEDYTYTATTFGGSGDGSGDVASAKLVYAPANGVTVKTTYVNLLGEINAAGTVDEVTNILEHEHFDDVFNIVSGADEYYDRLTAAVNDGRKEDASDDKKAAGDKAAAKKARIDERITELTPDDGYTADELRELFENLAALQQLLDIVDEAEADGSLDYLTPADQTLTKDIKEQAEKLLDGKDPDTGKILTALDLDEVLDDIHSTGDSLYKVLLGVRYDTIVLTVKTNREDGVSVNTGDVTADSDPGGLRKKAAESAFCQLSTAPGTTSADSAEGSDLTAFPAVLVKDTAPKMTITVTEGVTLKAVNIDGIAFTIPTAEGEENQKTGLKGAKLTKTSGGYELQLQKANTADHLTITVEFEATRYSVDVPSAVTEGTDDNVKILANVSSNARNTAEDGGTAGKYAEHGEDLVLTLAPTEGSSFIPGAKVSYKENGMEKKAEVATDGTVTIPDVQGAITEIDLSGAVKATGDALTDYVAALKTDGSGYTDSDRDRYTPATWVEFRAALTAADNDSLPEDGKAEKYADLLAAQQGLTRQYELNLSGAKVNTSIDATLSVPDGNVKAQVDREVLNANGYGGATVKFLQNGVVMIDSRYYVQAGRSVSLKVDSGLDEGYSLTEAAYTQTKDGDTAVSGRAAVVTGNDSFTIPNVQGAISAVKLSAAARSFHVSEKLEDGTGATDSTNATVYSLSGVSAGFTPTGGTTADVTGMDVGIKISGGTTADDFTITVTGRGANPTVTVTPKGGSAVTLRDITGLTGIDIAADPTAGTTTATLSADDLAKITAAYNETDAGHKSPIVVSKDTTAAGTVRYTETSAPDVGGDAATGDRQAKGEAAAAAGTSADVPTYTVTPETGKHVTSVTVDGREVQLPAVTKTPDGDEDVKYDFSVKDGTFTVAYNYGTPTSVTVDPGTDCPFTVTFGVDARTGIIGTNAVVTWKSADSGNHYAVTELADNVYDLTVDSAFTGGTVTIASVTPAGKTADRSGTITHGRNAVITLTPAAGMKVDTNALIELRVDAAASSKLAGCYTSFSLQEILAGSCPSLSAERKNGVYKITVRDIADIVSGAGVSTGLDTTGGVTSNLKVQPADYNGILFISSSADAGKYADSLKALLDELKESIDLGDKINTDATDSTYDKSADSWKNFAGDGTDTRPGELAEAKELYDTLTNDDGSFAFAGVTDMDELLDALNNALGVSNMSETGLTNLVSGAKDALDETILSLTFKPDTDLAVLPGLTDEVSVQTRDSRGKVVSEEKIQADVTPNDGGLLSTGAENLVVDGIPAAPGTELTSIQVEFKYVHKSNGITTCRVNIPVDAAGSAFTADDVKDVTIDDGDGYVNIEGDNRGTVRTNPDGSKRVSVPARTLYDIWTKYLSPNEAVIAGIVLVREPIKAFAVSGAASADDGIDTTSDSPQVSLGTDEDGDKITVGKNSITVSGIVAVSGSSCKGLEITVTDSETGEVYVAVINKAETPEITVSADELAAAVNKAMGKDGTNKNFDGIIVTDVKVVSDRLTTDLGGDADTGKDAATGEGIVRTPKPTAYAPAADGTGYSAGDLVVDNITTKPGHEVGGVTVEVTDPNTGKTVKVEVPVTGSEFNANVLVDGAVVGSIPVTAPNAGATVTEGTASGKKAVVSGATLNVILDALQEGVKDETGKTAAGVTTGVVTGAGVYGTRTGYGLPGEAEKGRGIGGDAVAVTPDDGDITKEENLKLSPITVEAGYSLDNVELTVKNPGTGMPIVIKIPAELSATDEGETTKLELTCTDRSGNPHTIRADAAVPDAVTTAEDTAKTVTIPGATLDAFIRAAVKGALQSEFGYGQDKLDEIVPDGTPVNTDISSIKVSARAETGAALPDTAIPADPNQEAPTINEDAIRSRGTGGYTDMTIRNVSTDDRHLPTGVTVAVTVPTGTEGETAQYEVTLPVSYPAVDITGKVEAQKLNPDTGEATGETVDISGALNGLPGGEAAASGANGTAPYTITVPGETIAEVIKALEGKKKTDTLTNGDLQKVTIDRVAVEEEGNGHSVEDARANAVKDDGLTAKPSIRTLPGSVTGVVEEIDPLRGLSALDVKTGGADENESVQSVTFQIGGSTGTAITVDTDGNITVTRNGKPVDAAETLAGLKSGVTVENRGVDGKGPYDIKLSPVVVSAILELTGENDGRNEANYSGLTRVTVNTTKPGTPTGGESGDGSEEPVPDVPGASGTCVPCGVKAASRQNTAPAVVRPTDDLVVDNIRPESGMDIVGISITAGGRTISIPAPAGEDGELTVTDENGKSYDIPVPGAVTTGSGSFVNSQRVTVPGAALDAILEGVLGADGADADIDGIHVLTKVGSWLLPRAEEVLTADHDGLTGLSMTSTRGVDGTESGTSTAAIGAADETVTGNETDLLLPRTGSALILNMTFRADDVQPTGATADNNRLVYHTLKGIVIDGTLLRADELAAAGVMTWLQGGDPQKDRTSQTGKVSIDTEKLAEYYKSVTGRAFPGFESMELSCVPQNTQYLSFMEDYGDIDKVLTDNKVTYSDGTAVAKLLNGMSPAARQNLENVVRKLREQLDKAPEVDDGGLSADNLTHLMDKLPVVTALMTAIESYHDAEDAHEDIDGLCGDVSEKLGKDPRQAAGELENALNTYSRSADKKKEEAQKKIEDIRSRLGDLLSDELPDINGDYDLLANDYLRDNVADEDGNLETLNRISELLDIYVLGQDGYARKLADELGTCPTFDTGTDSIRDNTKSGGKTVSGRIDELRKFEKALDKAQKAYDDLTDKTTPSAVSAYKALKKAGEDLNDAIDRLADIYLKDYATTDGQAYDAGSGADADGTSAKSANGIRDDTGFDKITAAETAYEKLPGSVRDKVDEKFYGSTVPELYGAALNDFNGVNGDGSRDGGKDSNNGSRGGGTASSGGITVDRTGHGKITVSPEEPDAGSTVTLTVEPDRGWTLETLKILDRNGNEIEPEIVKAGEKYTFRMPSGAVTIEATFMEDNTMLNYFVDVPAGSYYYDAVLWAVENGITEGTDDTHFSPDGVCTRAQAMTFLWRVAGCPEPETEEMPFVDVPKNAYYYDAVQWGTEKGITIGTSDTTFSPEMNCSRGQIVTLLWRAEGFPAAGTVNPFADVAEDAYYADAVLWAVKEAVTTGTSGTTFSPDGDCMRSEIVTFIWRTHGK